MILLIYRIRKLISLKISGGEQSFGERGCTYFPLWLLGLYPQPLCAHNPQDHNSNLQDPGSTRSWPFLKKWIFGIAAIGTLPWVAHRAGRSNQSRPRVHTGCQLLQVASVRQENQPAMAWRSCECLEKPATDSWGTWFRRSLGTWLISLHLPISPYTPGSAWDPTTC